MTVRGECGLGVVGPGKTVLHHFVLASLQLLFDATAYPVNKSNGMVILYRIANIAH